MGQGTSRPPRAASPRHHAAENRLCGGNFAPPIFSTTQNFPWPARVLGVWWPVGVLRAAAACGVSECGCPVTRSRFLRGESHDASSHDCHRPVCRRRQPDGRRHRLRCRPRPPWSLQLRLRPGLCRARLCRRRAGVLCRRTGLLCRGARLRCRAGLLCEPADPPSRSSRPVLRPACPPRWQHERLRELLRRAGLLGRALLQRGLIGPAVRHPPESGAYERGGGHDVPRRCLYGTARHRADRPLAGLRRLVVTRASGPGAEGGCAVCTARLDILSNVPWPASAGWW